LSYGAIPLPGGKNNGKTAWVKINKRKPLHFPIFRFNPFVSGRVFESYSVINCIRSYSGDRYQRASRFKARLLTRPVFVENLSTAKKTRPPGLHSFSVPIYMSHIQTYQLPDFARVYTVHVLTTGEIISSLEDYLKVKERFAWVDQSHIISSIFRLRRLTESPKKSVIVIYEENRAIKEYVNVEENFKPLIFS
jgi:hypothetical protein